MKKIWFVLLALLLVTWTTAADVVVDSSNSTAQYRVREQLAGIAFPSDAIGVTTGVNGTITIEDDGTVAASSLVTIDVSTLTSDQNRRDNFLKRSVLETENHPTVTFAPVSIDGLPAVLPTSGSYAVEITGLLTVRDVSTTVTWSGTATFDSDAVLLEAATTFTFDDIDMSKPRVASVLSVADDITLEVSLTLQVIE